MIGLFENSRPRLWGGSYHHMYLKDLRQLAHLAFCKV